MLMPILNDWVNLMSENFVQSLMLTVAGMGTVLVFLTILVYVTKFAGTMVQSLETKYGSIIKPDAVKTKAPAPKSSNAAKQDMSDIAAVLAIAHKEYGLPLS